LSNFNRYSGRAGGLPKANYKNPFYLKRHRFAQISAEKYFCLDPENLHLSASPFFTQRAKEWIEKPI
jgi:hypothetical protein